MSKRQEIRARRRREQIRNRIIIILLVVAGALLVAFALILPSIQNCQECSQCNQNGRKFHPATGPDHHPEGLQHQSGWSCTWVTPVRR